MIRTPVTALPCKNRCHDVAPVEDGDVPQRVDATAEMELQERTAGLVCGQWLRIGQAASRIQLIPSDAQVQPRQVITVVDDGPGRSKFIQKPRKQLANRLRATGEETVQMPALRHARALFGTIGQSVAVDDGDRFIGLREHPGGEQPRDAGTQNHRV